MGPKPDTQSVGEGSFHKEHHKHGIGGLGRVSVCGGMFHKNPPDLTSIARRDIEGFEGEILVGEDGSKRNRKCKNDTQCGSMFQ
jgi:hypothetical protein